MEINKISLSDLGKNEEWEKAVIVFTEDSFPIIYPLESRSYLVSRKESKRFQNGKISNSIYGDSLDHTDLGVRLDLYLHDWKIDYCYIAE